MALKSQSGIDDSKEAYTFRKYKHYTIITSSTFNHPPEVPQAELTSTVPPLVAQELLFKSFFHHDYWHARKCNKPETFFSSASKWANHLQGRR